MYGQSSIFYTLKINDINAKKMSVNESKFISLSFKELTELEVSLAVAYKRILKREDLF